jgi:hypothetical protein
VLLDGHDHVAEHRRTARAGDDEQIRQSVRRPTRSV